MTRSESLVGKVLADYETLAELGQGGMGTVYRARERALDRIVALKVLEPRATEDTEVVRRFLSGVRATARLVHPNIVRVYGVGQSGRLHYIAMQYVEGCSLAQLILAEGPRTPAEALRIARDVAEALAEAHRHAILHCGVNPRSIMIGRDGAVKVTDFGLAGVARTAGHVTERGALLGAPGYMSPEQIQGKAADVRTDVYALGLVFYEMLAGFSAFQAETPAVTMHQVLHTPLPGLVGTSMDLPSVVKAILERSTAKQADQRYSSMNELAADLRAAAASLHGPPATSETATPRSGLAATVAGPFGSLAEYARAHKRRFVMALAGTAVCVLAAAFFLGRGGGMPPSENTGDTQDAMATTEVAESLSAAAFEEPSESTAKPSPIGSVTLRVNAAAWKVIETSDGRYAACGNITLEDGPAVAFLASLTRDGTCQWARVYGARSRANGRPIADEGYHDARSLLAATDGGFVFMGKGDADGAPGIWVVRTDEAGGELWRASFCEPDKSYLVAGSIAKSTRGSYLVIGTIRDGGLRGKMLLIAVNDDGGMEWRRTYELYGGELYGGNGEWRTHGYAVASLSTGDLMLGGYIENSERTQRACVIRTDPEGREILHWMGEGKLYRGRITSLTEVPGLGVICAGDNPGRAQLLLFSVEGTRIRTRGYDPSEIERISSVVPLEPEGFAMVGRAERPRGATPHSKYYTTVLVGTDSYGNLKWRKELGIGADTNALDLCTTSDGGFLVAGMLYSSVTRLGSASPDCRQAWVAKTDAQGNLEWSWVLDGALYKEMGWPM